MMADAKEKGFPWEKFLWIAIFTAALLVGAGFRFYQLELRVVHGDEANQAVKAGQLLETGKYRYDPREHHGPTLYYMALPILKAAGITTLKASQIHHYRMVPAICGFLLLFVVAGVMRPFGRWAIFWAVLFTAISHAMTYYSRYFVQETAFVLFTYAAVGALWWCWKRPSRYSAAAFGLAIGLLHATKETAIVVVAALAAAGIATAVYSRIRDGRRPEIPGADSSSHSLFRRYAGLFGVAALAAAFVSVLFFSSFFTYARGPLDSILTYTTYAGRAEGAGYSAAHDKPWYYYLLLLAWTYRSAGPRWTEAPMLFLALIGVLAALLPRRNEANGEALPLARFIAFFTIFLTVVFSMIPYKTPWNLLVFYEGMLLLAGVGAVTLLRIGRFRVIRAILLIFLMGGVGWQGNQAWQGNFVYPADGRNPYVYAHTSTAIRRLADRIRNLRAIDPAGDAMIIKVIIPGGDYWPLPWYLREMTRVGYWGALPEDPNAAVIITPPQAAAALKPLFKEDYFSEIHALRPGALLQVYIRRDLWDAFIATRQ